MATSGTEVHVIKQRGGQRRCWVQPLGVGVDRFPLDALPADQTLACPGGSTAVPISELVPAAMLSHDRAMPEVWVDESPSVTVVVNQ